MTVEETKKMVDGTIHMIRVLKTTVSLSTCQRCQRAQGEYPFRLFIGKSEEGTRHRTIVQQLPQQQQHSRKFPESLGVCRAWLKEKRSHNNYP